MPSNHSYHYDTAKANKLLAALLAHDYTICTGVIYHATIGTPMGVTYSSELSSLTFWALERRLIPHLRDAAHRLYGIDLLYLRYADDTCFNIPHALLTSVMNPTLGHAGIHLEHSARFPGGMPFLEIRVHLDRRNRLSTTHHSTRHDLNPDEPYLLRPDGATRPTTATNAVTGLIRRIYTSTSHYRDFLHTLMTVILHEFPHYHPHTIAHAVERFLTSVPENLYRLSRGAIGRLAKHLRLRIRKPANK